MNLSKDKKKILITGGCGFIGSAVIRKLISQSNLDIYNLDKMSYASNHISIEEKLNSRSKKNINYKLLRTDLYDYKSTMEAVDFASPDLILHLAAESHVDRSIDSSNPFINSNIVGTYNLLESTRRYWNKLNIDKKEKFKFVHISTDEVFGSLDEIGSFDENTSYSPRSPYSATKAASDHLVAAWNHTYDLPTLITNCSNNYGPWQFPEKLIPLVINKAINNERIPIYGDGLNVRDWLYVEDHVDAIIKVADEGEPGERFCIGGNNEQRNIDLVRKICNLLDEMIPKEQKYENLIEFVKDRPGHDRRYAINSTLIKEKLSWSPKYSFNEGISKTIKWYLNNQRWFKITSEKRIINLIN